MVLVVAFVVVVVVVEGVAVGDVLVVVAVLLPWRFLVKRRVVVRVQVRGGGVMGDEVESSVGLGLEALEGERDYDGAANNMNKDEREMTITKQSAWDIANVQRKIPFCRRCGYAFLIKLKFKGRCLISLYLIHLRFYLLLTDAWNDGVKIEKKC